MKRRHFGKVLAGVAAALGLAPPRIEPLRVTPSPADMPPAEKVINPPVRATVTLNDAYVRQYEQSVLELMTRGQSVLRSPRPEDIERVTFHCSGCGAQRTSARCDCG